MAYPLLVLVDGHALAYRAFFALRESGLRSSRGEPTYAVFGFAQILLTALAEYRPDYAAVAFDVGRTFRDDLYAEYKAGRAETPEEFYPQFERIKQLVQALNIPIYTAEGYEADDVIGTLARQATERGVDTIILTGDSDVLQLVNDHVRVALANPYGGKTSVTLYDLEQVRKRYDGLEPDQLADLRGLKGDTSDNIPGVRGIGEKGAIALLKQFRSLDALLEQIDAAPKRYQTLLREQAEAARFSRQLATIVTDVPVQLDLEAARIGVYDRSAVMALFQELEFGVSSNLIKKLPSVVQAPTLAELPADLPAAPLTTAPTQLSLFAGESEPAQPTAEPPPVTIVRDATALADLVSRLRNAPAFAFDTECTSLQPVASDLVGISIAIAPDTVCYIPVGHQSETQVPCGEVVTALAPFFANPQQPKFAHNAKFDMEVLAGAGIKVSGLAFDTMIAAAMLGKRQGLKDLAFYELKLPEPPTTIEDLIGRGNKQISFAEVPVEQAAPYAAADALYTLRLTERLQRQLEAEPALHDLYYRVELPLIEVLTDMELTGIRLDQEYLRELGRHFAQRIADLVERIYQQAGGPFNINSGQQLNDVLFGRLGIDPRAHGLSKLKSGGYSITAEVLEELSQLYPIAADILTYRQLTKLKSTYIDALPDLVNPRTGRIHTSYNQLGAATGRLSSNNPNLQNIPVRTEEGREIRRAFVAEPGWRFVAADYSQIELRVLAHMSGDENLIAAFQQGLDIHAATASRLFGVEPTAVDKNQRRVAKTVVFGVIYGISAFGLAQRLGIERDLARQLIDNLFAQFPGIRRYIDQTLEFGRQHGYVQTLFGRRRVMEDLRASGARRAAAEREAINAPIQGTAADLMKMAMVNVHRALREQGLRTRLLLQVHDELIAEAPEDEVEPAARLLRDVMSSVYRDLVVPLSVNLEVGPNWDEMSPLAMG
ncbi:MAG TPA: DNA polymerase I [Chloroflexus aurantiacus]|jgi:DNA polymerase-1|uniref:DNA polymerase I n=1 Tax=Chloroflexus aurantiacus (strain ATCC 29366 / DSM 635 / J-10-fl) TaxID=324602 RepID=DPO1_CHLAA|nr:DNA polymerase I [Chloroflexus aurantiacus]O08307.1 RecName: Full=DNA polymerase I; Short=POL I [Chloroflexus aurantiacus J-10-fl]RMG52550.1 MAG: DNA polymerase I [Chloroflexota bacterium]ABY33592.1 DNA polymerase I [Chloroflexus aurantiacus J-10-fl]CAA72997.1 DNA-directed DNA polymerase I [Chloroflexus aurantiacus J-10-fl]HBW67217.1 DNA polymerase I [Chloroflexus aurantiacus]